MYPYNYDFVFLIFLNECLSFQRKRRYIYETQKDDQRKTSQTSMDTYALTSSKHTKYTTHDPNQITEALVSFIAGSLTPLSVVENPEFKFLIESLNPRYQLPSRKHFSTKLLLERSTSIQNSLKSKLRAVESVCLTIDLWSNRQMKGFIGITGHFILVWCIESIMVSCKRFRGQHCAENIRQEYEEAVACYNKADKITNIVTDNATNMAKAFQVTLPGFTCDKDTSLKEDTHESDSEDEEEDSSLEPMVFD